jgi:hypothetical protein
VQATYKYADEGSPLAAFLITFQNIVQTRTLAKSAGMVFKWSPWVVFVQDLTMLFEEGTTLGCRTAWIRRVLVPVLQAQAALQKGEGTDVDRARDAIHLLGALRNADDDLYATCRAWITERFLTEKPAEVTAAAVIEAKAALP